MLGVYRKAGRGFDRPAEPYRAAALSRTVRALLERGTGLCGDPGGACRSMSAEEHNMGFSIQTWDLSYPEN
jgi:hypothetical protein